MLVCVCVMIMAAILHIHTSMQRGSAFEGATIFFLMAAPSGNFWWLAPSQKCLPFSSALWDEHGEGFGRSMGVSAATPWTASPSCWFRPSPPPPPPGTCLLYLLDNRALSGSKHRDCVYWSYLSSCLCHHTIPNSVNFSHQQKKCRAAPGALQIETTPKSYNSVLRTFAPTTEAGLEHPSEWRSLPGASFCHICLLWGLAC